MRIGVLVSDMTLPGAPIIFINSGFEAISGYTNEELYGHSCRCMTSPATNADTISQMRYAMQHAQEVALLGYA